MSTSHFKKYYRCLLIVGIGALLSCERSSMQYSRTLDNRVKLPPLREVAFINANVIPMTGEEVLEDYTVLVRNGKIVRVGPSKKVKTTEKTSIINCQGKYILPGLAEMHAHIPIPQDDSEIVEETLFLFLANGITTIRGMLGHPYHLELQNLIKKGELLSPRIYTSGPSLNGRSVQSDSAARIMVRQQEKAGYDFLKLHPGLSLSIFNTIANTAKEVDIPFAGHVSTDVGIRRALRAGYASIDHIDGFLEGLVPESAAVDPDENGFFGFNFTRLADTTKMDELVRMTKTHDVWVVPTESLLQNMCNTVPADKLAEMQYVSKTTLNAWINRKKSFMRDSDYDAETAALFLEIRKKFIRKLYEDGEGILLGSDAPQIFNVPGFSIHRELSYYVEAGLTPYEAIYTGTVNPAKFFDAEKKIGTIQKGRDADLILVDANPLESVENLKKISGVLVRGFWLSESTIQERLDEIAEKYAD